MLAHNPGTVLDLANKKCFEWAGSRALCSQSSVCRELLIPDSPLPWLWLGWSNCRTGGEERNQGNFYPFPLLQVSSLIAGLSRSSFTKTDWSCLSCFQANPVPGVQKPHPLCECPQPLWRSLFSCFTISHGLLPSSISCVTKYLYFSMLRFFFPLIGV